MGINEVISRRLERIEESISRLREAGKITKQEFLTDWKYQDATIRNFQVAIEACLDMGSYLIALSGWKSPEGYTKIVEILGEKGVLPKDFIEKAKDMVKFRNIIVHDYLYIDLNKVYSNLKQIDDLRQFARYIVEFIESSQKECV